MYYQSVDSVVFDMASGFLHDGLYVQKKPALEKPLMADFKRAADPSAPIAVIMHGYRGDMRGANNIMIGGIFQERGFSTLRVGFGGYDHYGLEAAPHKADDATYISNLQDVGTIFDSIGADHTCVLVANSGSINFAQAAVASRPNVRHIAAISPFPNIVPFMLSTLQKSFEAQAALDDFGYIIPPGYGPMCKITRTFLEAGQPADLHDVDALAAFRHKPKISIVRSQHDAVVGNAGLVEPWVQASRQAGYIVEDRILAGDAHKPDDAMLAVLVEQAALIQTALRCG